MLTVSTYNNNVNSVNIFYDMKYHHGDLKGALVKSACIVCCLWSWSKILLPGCVGALCSSNIIKLVQTTDTYLAIISANCLVQE